MDPLALKLLLARFDTMERLLKDNGEKLDAHKEDDLLVAKQVNTHSTYWNIFGWTIGSIALTIFTWVATHIK